MTVVMALGEERERWAGRGKGRQIGQRHPPVKSGEVNVKTWRAALLWWRNSFAMVKTLKTGEVTVARKNIMMQPMAPWWCSRQLRGGERRRAIRYRGCSGQK